MTVYICLDYKKYNGNLLFEIYCKNDRLYSILFIRTTKVDKECYSASSFLGLLFSSADWKLFFDFHRYVFCEFIYF